MESIDEKERKVADLEQRVKLREEVISALQLRLQQRKKKILWLTLGVLLGIVALFIIAWLSTYSRPALKETRPIITFFATVIALAGATLIYLQPSTVRRPRSDSQASFRRLREYLDDRLGERSDRGESPITDGSEQANGNVVSVEHVFSSITGRLGREVQDQAKRGALNLILGIVTTLMGLAVLGYSVLSAPGERDMQEILAYFLPRISLALLIEVFAYFFLRLYKQSLSEIKYFQNEITNVDSRYLAIKIAEKSTEPGLLGRIVDELMKTERNFLMSKDQTTIEIEQERLTRSTYSELIAAIKDLRKTKD